jgi:hypothetical protein
MEPNTLVGAVMGGTNVCSGLMRRRTIGNQTPRQEIFLYFFLFLVLLFE